MWQFPLFPDQASTIARQIDLVYFVLLGLSAFFAIGVAGAIAYFAVKYRAGSDANRSNAVTDHLGIEVTWTLIPLGLAVGVFVWGAGVYYEVQTPPMEEPLEIYAVGQQWMWKFQHHNGVREINTLHVPAGRSVRMIMTSQDVIHSFYVPAFRVKQDVLPGRLTYAWFEATKTGTYHLFCAEYCGTQHSLMRGRVRVMDLDAYERWLRVGETADADVGVGTRRYGGVERGRDGPGPPVDGAVLFEELRCHTCHRTDSSAFSPSTGPVLEGVYGRPVRLRNERVIIADEEYLLESILYPAAKIVQGYPPLMPTYAGQVSEMEAMQLVAYLQTLSEGRLDEPDADAEAPPATNGSDPAQENEGAE